MGYSDEQLNKIYDKTDGHCHICNKRLAWVNYGTLEMRGSWEVDHSNPKANGGSDRLINLWPACVSCNRSKGFKSTRSQRKKNGLYSAPISYKAKQGRNLDWIALIGLLLLFYLSNLNKIKSNEP